MQRQSYNNFLFFSQILSLLTVYKYEYEGFSSDTEIPLFLYKGIDISFVVSIDIVYGLASTLGRQKHHTIVYVEDDIRLCSIQRSDLDHL